MNKRLEIYLFVILFYLAFTSIVSGSDYKVNTNAQSYILEKLKTHHIVFLGTTHRKQAILKFLSDLIPALHDAGVTHIGMEIAFDQQAKIDKIYQNLRQGDRIVVGTITSHSYIDFKPVVDAEIPKQSVWDNRLQYEQNLTKTKKNIRKSVDRLLSRKRGTPYTEILNSLNVVDTIFHSEKRTKILVILSDMIQDSKQYKFGRHKISNKYISNVIRNQKEQNLVPNLADVKVYAAGVSASNSKKFRSIQKFWSRYFKESKADFSTHRYGHSLIEFEKGS